MTRKPPALSASSSTPPEQRTSGGAFGEDRGTVYGIMVMQAATFMFATNDMAIKLIGGTLPPGQIGVLRNCFAIALLVFACIWTGQYRLYRQSLGKVVMLRANFEAVASMLFLIALPHLPLANYTSFLLVIPLIATAAAALFFRDKVGVRRWSAIFVGLAGVFLIIRPGLEGYNSYALFSLGAVVLAAGRDLATRYLPKGSALWVVTLTTMIVSTIAAGLYGLTEVWLPVSGYQWLILALSAFFVTAGQAALMVAMNHGEFSAVAPFRYVGMLFALIYGYIFWRDIPDTLTWIGIILILAAGLYSILRERQLGKQRNSSR